MSTPGAADAAGPGLAGTVIGRRYRLERELGRGGMATVWLARDQDHERDVAVKVIHPELAGAIGVDRFVREVRLTGRLQHPNIVQLLDSGTLPASDGRFLPWYAMPYLEGESLRARLARERQLPVDEALRIAEAVGAALTAAHHHDIVHRDIKPDNVFLSGAHVYVVDFGIAKALVDTEAERLTSTGLAIGTPAYMSPEQALAGEVDARSDQYSLAAILYEMFAGEPPFTGPTAQAIVARRFAEPARPFRPVRSTVPEAVERAVLRALERTPADRFPDVAAFVAALRAGDSGLTTGPRRRTTRRGWWAAAMIVLVALAGLAFALKAGRPGKGGRDPAVEALHRRAVLAYDRRTPEGVAEAIAAFREAVERDSTYAAGWTGLAYAYVRAHIRGFQLPGLSRDSLLHRAVDAANRARAADPNSADAWRAQAEVSAEVDPTSLVHPLRAIREAIRLDSTRAPSWYFLGVYLAESGDLAGAIGAWRRSVEAEPGYAQGLAFLGMAHYWRRGFDSAAAWADSAIAVDPTYLLGRTAAGQVAVERGEFERAAGELDAALRLSTDVELGNTLALRALVEARRGAPGSARALLARADSIGAGFVPVPLHLAILLAHAYAGLGAVEAALSRLEQVEPRRHVHFQLHLRCDPPFDPLRGDPRFEALLVRPSPPPGEGC